MVTIPNVYPMRLRFVILMTDTRRVNRCIIIIIIIVSESGRVFLCKLGRKLPDQSGDDREISFLFQRLSVLVQRYNTILLHDCFVKEE